MLGRYVRVKITKPFGSSDDSGYCYPLNFGLVEGGNGKQGAQQGAFIMGIHHPVRNFDGRVIAILSKKGSKPIWVVAPKSTRFIINDIKKYLDFNGPFKEYKLDCLYETSCGAVIFRTTENETNFLLIKNKRSTHWGFPKGHVEVGETKEETAIREVLEETGMHITLLSGFATKSDYKIQGRIEKSVTIFLGQTTDTDTVIQQEEIEDFIWMNYENALNFLKFENDKVILRQANDFLTHKKRNLITS